LDARVIPHPARKRLRFHAPAVEWRITITRSLLQTARTVVYRGRKSRDARAWRPEWLPFWIATDAENRVHPHAREERADLFLAHNAGSTEIEVLNWLHATVCLLKPATILETGAADGLGTLALASACRANGFGVVHSIEIDAARCRAGEALLARYGVAAHALFHPEDSRAFLRRTTLTFELAWFDSLCELRADEHAICRERGLLRGPAAFHDTSPRRTETLTDWPAPAEHAEYRRRLREAARQPGISAFESTLSRGLFLLFPSPTE
jgi:hypothetical protein